jgi:4-amino-4-deoxy-L-arabinose transferase-like glycosyltransferase
MNGHPASGESNGFRAEQHVKTLLLLLLATLLLVVVIMAAVPPVSRDALTHHLAVPKLYLRHGGIVELPDIPFSYYPMAIDMLYLLPLALGSDIAPKYIHFAFALLTAALIWSYLKNQLGGVYGLLGALLFLSLPVIVKLSITVYVDLGLIFFSTGALLLLLRWMDSGLRPRCLFFAAVVCGLCLGTKYNGLVTFFILSCFVPLIYISGRRIEWSESDSAATESHSPPVTRKPLAMRASGCAILFIALALAVFSPWMIRNYAWTKNPLYPLFGSIFASESNVSGPESEEGEVSRRPFGHFMIRKHIYREPFWWTMLIPVRIFFQGQDDNPRLFDGRMNPYLFFLPLAAFLLLCKASRIQRVHMRFLLLFTVIYLWIAFFKTDMRIRYIAPIIPPLVILSVFGLHRLVEGIRSLSNNAGRKAAGIAFSVGLILLMTLNGLYAADLFRRVQSLDYLAGRVSRGEYIRQRRPEYAVMQYANRQTPDTSRILGLFLGNRRYYSEREMQFGNNLLLDITRRAGSAEDISSELKKKGFTHLMIGYRLFNEWYGKQLDAADRSKLQYFLDHTARRLTSMDGHGLFAL